MPSYMDDRLLVVIGRTGAGVARIRQQYRSGHCLVNKHLTSLLQATLLDQRIPPLGNY